MGKRKSLIALSVTVMLIGLGSAVARQFSPGGSDAFNLGVDFQGGSVITAKFRGGMPADDKLRAALRGVGLDESVIQASTDKKDEVLIKIPLIEGESTAEEKAPAESPANKPADVNTNSGADSNASANQSVNNAENAANANATNVNAGAATNKEEPVQERAIDSSNQVSAGRALVQKALITFGKEAAAGTPLEQDKNAKFKIVGTDSVGPVAGLQLRNQAVIATLLGMVGILLFIAFRYDWTYAAGAVIAVFHDVLITLAFFTVFQWEVSLTVLAAFLTLVGFSVNDSIVIFDRIRENLTLKRTQPLYDLTNDSINQTMSRTIVTNGLFFLSVLALVLFGGEVLRGFSLALFVGAITGTYSTIAIASPIAIWWQSKLGAAKMKEVTIEKDKPLASAARKSVKRRPVSS